MGSLLLALLGYPLSVLANLTYDHLKEISTKIQINPLKRLFVAAFFKSLDYHDRGYDDYAKQEIGKLRRAVKKDNGKLLKICSKHFEQLRHISLRGSESRISRTIGQRHINGI